MGNFKGSGILALQKLFKGKTLQHDQFLAALTPDELKAFKTSLPVSWVQADMAAAISFKAANALYPADPKKLVKLGKERALVHVNGIYRLFFHVMNISSVLSHAAELWPTQHDTGKAWVEKGADKKSAVFCVSGYPDLPNSYLELIEGFVSGILEAAGAKNIRVITNVKDPNLWRWQGVWD